MEDQKLTNIQGIGPKTAERLKDLGIDSIKALSAAPTELLATVPGLFTSRAEAITAAAKEMVAKIQKTPAANAEMRQGRKTSDAKKKAKTKAAKAEKKAEKKEKKKVKDKAKKKADKKKIAKKKAVKKSKTKKTADKKKAAKSKAKKKASKKKNKK